MIANFSGNEKFIPTCLGNPDFPGQKLLDATGNSHEDAGPGRVAVALIDLAKTGDIHIEHIVWLPWFRSLEQPGQRVLLPEILGLQNSCFL